MRQNVMTVWLCSVPVCRLGGDERAQRCECCVDRIGAISLTRIGCGPLANLTRGRRTWGANPPHNVPNSSATSAPSYPAQLPLPVHLDVKGRWGRGGQAEGSVGRVGTLLRARALAPVLLIVFGEEGDVAVQEAACGRCRAQHGECHLHRNNGLTATDQSWGAFPGCWGSTCKFVIGSCLRKLMLLTKGVHHQLLFDLQLLFFCKKCVKPGESYAEWGLVYNLPSLTVMNLQVDPKSADKSDLIAELLSQVAAGSRFLSSFSLSSFTKTLHIPKDQFLSQLILWKKAKL